MLEASDDQLSQVSIKILFFAIVKDLTGKKEDRFCVPSVVKGSSLLDLIIKEYHLDTVRNNVILAVNEDWVDLDSTLTLKDSDEVAVIPPLSGGTF